MDKGQNNNADYQYVFNEIKKIKSFVEVYGASAYKNVKTSTRREKVVILV